MIRRPRGFGFTVDGDGRNARNGRLNNRGPRLGHRGEPWQAVGVDAPQPAVQHRRVG
jgi:hypothetical protein